MIYKRNIERIAIMKKIRAGIGIVGMIIILIKIVSDVKDKKAASSNIIGRADGSTSISLAGKGT